MPFASIDPTTGVLVEAVAAHDAAAVEAALDRAAGAFASFRTSSFEDRARLLVTVAELLEGELPDIAALLTEEMGKTFAAAKGEVAKCALAYRWFAEHGAALLADEVVESAATTSYVTYQPLGPVLAIMPWNFPLWQVTRFAAPALMAGNVCLLKHAPNVPRTARLLHELFLRAGAEPGVFTNLYVEQDDVAALVADPRVAAVTLTGSERAGTAVAAEAGAALKKAVMELGGSDAFVVLESAALDRAVATAVQARVQNNGQSCIAAKRFVVHESVADTFAERFSAAMGALVVGDPMDPATDVGPLVSAAQRRELAAQVDDAVAHGALVHCGGTVPEGPGFFYPPTVLSGVTPAMRVAREEVFGPVAMLYRVGSLDEAIARANDTDYGLGASVWTTDPAEQRRCVAELEVGQVFVNAMVASTPELPFGGIKRSGFGRELSSIGIKEFTNPKTVWIA